MSHEQGTMTGKEKLVYMANQIAAFFGSAMPQDQAVAGIADHLNKFWEVRMRRQLLEIIDAGGVGLSPLVIEAASQVRKPALI
ncbi:MAG: formate dehydrogenase subunit delta [Mesorhizobium sp.]|jgi:formate dehydrogenase subunit delta